MLLSMLSYSPRDEHTSDQINIGGGDGAPGGITDGARVTQNCSCIHWKNDREDYKVKASIGTLI